MRIGFIGLGKMGHGMVRQLLDRGHQAVVYDRNPKEAGRLARYGAQPVASLGDLAAVLQGTRIVWVMVPHFAVDSVLTELLKHLKKGDMVVDGGNSPFKDSQKRAARLKRKGIAMLDIGVSGGPNGARHGACMMVGGDAKAFRRLRPMLASICVPNGLAHVGSSGAGHFVKMVHNGIEYGMMQSLAEGFELLKKYPGFRLDLAQVAKVYSHGSVIESSLTRWLGQAFNKFGPALKGVSARAVGTGEGRWTVEAGKQVGLDMPAIRQSYLARGRSRKSPSFAARIVMALRSCFGGHDPNPSFDGE